MPCTKHAEFILWAAQPPGTDDLTMLAELAGLAEPLLDLRWGDADYRHGLLRRAAASDLRGLTVMVDVGDADTLAATRALVPAEGRVILCADRLEVHSAADLAAGLKDAGLMVGFEVDSRQGARMAFEAGADFLLASANEAAGPVSKKTSLILAQELLDGVTLPLVVRGGVGPLGAAALYAAGCTGCVLDSQLLLTPEAPIEEALREPLRTSSPFDTAAVGGMLGRPMRVLASGRAQELKELRRLEHELFLAGLPAEQAASRFAEELAPLVSDGFGSPLPPVGQGLAFARRFAEQGLSVRGVVSEYAAALGPAVERLKEDFPFRRGSALASEHGTQLPIVQGPMAEVSGTHHLPERVAASGALPFLAAADQTPQQLSKAIADTRAALKGRPFGVGMVAFMGSDPEAFEAVCAARPDCVTLAGGDATAARRFEEAGIRCYLHTPSSDHVAAALDGGARGIILEGHEAGGHVGALGSLVLWELATEEIARRDTAKPDGLRVLFAGGLATARASVMAGVFGAALSRHGAACGLQLGTAYLATEEAVACGAVPAAYRQALLLSDESVTTGTTVNLPARWSRSESALELLKNELEIEGTDAPLAERKRAVERLNAAHLRAAVGRGGPDAPSPPSHMCGQAISSLLGIRTMAELHSELTDRAGRLAESTMPPSTGPEDLSDAIAIVGMACLFPGADDPEQYWQNIVNRVEAVTEVPEDRWDVDLFYDPRPEVRDKSSSRLGAFVQGFRKDPTRFRIPPVAAPAIDRVQFMALQVAHEALEDAGCLEKGLPRDHTSVVLGNSMGGELSVRYGMRVYAHEYCAALRELPEIADLPSERRDAIIAGAATRLTEKSPRFTEDSCPGTLGSLIAGRICNHFNLGGVSFTLDGACASSLAALNTAVQALRTGQAQVVLAGGAEAHMDPFSYIMFSNLGVLSDKGCYPFDDRADGFVMGEGVGMVVLKCYADAVRDGDRIHALIRGLGSSSDGSAKSVTAPDVRGQTMAMERAYENLPFTPAAVDLVEAHGTGTWNGDLTELTSLNTVWSRHTDRPRSVGLGSVKSMIGHTKTAAGIAGLIKVVMALRHKTLPPTIHCEQPRSAFDWEASPFYLITEPKPWRSAGRPRRAAVNSFGFGGVNFHAVLEEAPGPDEHPPARSGHVSALPAHLVTLRGSAREEVLGAADALAQRLRDGQPLGDLARESWERIGDGPAALAVVARDAEAFHSCLERARRALADPDRTEYSNAQGVYYGEQPAGATPKVAFLFPGQGSHYLGMGGDLPDAFPFLLNTFEDVDRLARRWTGVSVLNTLFPEPDATEEERGRLEELLVRTDHNHPALLAMWVGLSSLLRRAGVRPRMAAGHSVGEYGALHAAGVFDLETAVAVTTLRGARVYEHAFRAGAMAAAGAPADQVEEVLAQVGGQAVVANKNCPAQTVISGTREAIDSVVETLQSRGIRCAVLPVTSGFHSPLISTSVEPFRQVLEDVPVRRPAIPVQCNVTGAPYDGDGEFAAHLRDALAQHLVRPVEFVRNVESLYEAGARLFVEVGPGSTLCSFVDNILGDRPHWTFPTNLQRAPASLQVLHALGFCFARGLQVNSLLKKSCTLD